MYDNLKNEVHMPCRSRCGAARWCLVGTAMLALGLFAPRTPVGYAADLTLHEAGSTLLYPLFQRWVPDYAAANPGTVMTTNATGSGDGIAQAIAGHVQIGASDAYMSDEQAEQNRGVVLCQEDAKASCCARDEGGPFEAAL